MYIFLGFLRFSLATFVFIVHTDSVTQPLSGFVNWAGLGVWVFFIISGYVIFSAYDSFYRGRVSAYLVNRCVRIYPTLWVCLLLSLFFLYLHETLGLNVYGIQDNGYGLREFVLGLSIIGGFINDSVWKPLPPAATLTVEMKFYFIAAVVFFVIARSKLSLERGLFVAAVVFLIAYVLVDITHSQYRWFGALRYSPLFVLGGVSYFTRRLGLDNTGIRLMWVIIVPLVLHFTLVSQSSTGYVGFNTAPVTLITAGLVILAVILMNWLVRQPINERLKRTDRFFGDLTYALYLVQIPVLAVVLPLAHWSGVGDWLVLYAINIAAAAVITLGIEYPLQTVRRRIRRHSIVE